ncbi:hypothetical protein ACE939_11075 [Aquimarina sp. W85]|uniref:hypothetical protein n=1 Tax=Aquimarina rhodophyticola TaxID=3342246 RepID=UPI00366F2C91
MNHLIKALVFVISIVAVNAQDKSITSGAEQNFIKTIGNSIAKSIDHDNVFYSKISKVTFYEALISQNELNIHLNDSDRVAIKNTEEIILNTVKQTLYTEVNY